MRHQNKTKPKTKQNKTQNPKPKTQNKTKPKTKPKKKQNPK
jgi:hypothetical protein